jgi:hypothetical protein
MRMSRPKLPLTLSKQEKEEAIKKELPINPLLTQ